LDPVNAENRGRRAVGAFGRLKSGATRAAAQTEMNGIAARPGTADHDTNKDLAAVRVETFNERFNGGQIQTVFLAMMGAGGFALPVARRPLSQPPSSRPAPSATL